MHLTTIVTALAATVASVSAAYSGPIGLKGQKTFQLQVIATGGNLAYSGLWLGPYHTGAGSNALVAANDQRSAQHFNFTTSNGGINATLGLYPYTLSLEFQGVNARAPSGYSFAGFNVGDGSKNHFHFTTPGNYLQFGPSFAKDNWAICPAAIYTPGVYVPTLVFRAPDAKKNATCADVKVKAVF